METYPKKIFKAKVCKSEILAKGVKKISFKIDEPFLFLAWQYVWVEISDMKVPDVRGSRRAFSILNSINNDNIIEIVARISDSGYKQSLFALKKGDEVTIHGPFGHSFIVDESHEPQNIIMIAGGVSIAVFLRMIETIKNKAFKTKCFLVYLNKNKETTPFLNQLKELKKSTKFFDYTVKYDLFDWNDVNAVVSSVKGEIEWWIAGSQQMVDHVFTILEEGGVSRVDMVFENFYPTSKNNLTRAFVLSQMIEANIFAKAIQNTTNHVVITDRGG